MESQAKSKESFLVGITSRRTNSLLSKWLQNKTINLSVDEFINFVIILLNKYCHNKFYLKLVQKFVLNNIFDKFLIREKIEFFILNFRNKFHLLIFEKQEYLELKLDFYQNQ
ncbi:hypothetical protein BpHYR1_000523 [Brachionus plicatilis]|uniref:Uncharacterized protein n=1 Tax=Brachionus plicatilis TaxID=10195 RepID=A0A3M7R464_BRAPC|nr:hypothetical protein BpHYR1_000523 [Brachionus plicatilis]